VGSAAEASDKVSQESQEVGLVMIAGLACLLDGVGVDRETGA